MRTIFCLAVALAAVGCNQSTPPPPPQKTAKSSVVTAAKPPPRAKATAAERAETGKARLEAFRAMRRARAYEQEGQARVPQVVNTALGALRPSGIPYKVLRAEVFRSMKLLKHNPGHAQFKLRLVTTERGGPLRAALEAPLRKAGWLGAQQTLRTPLEAPDGRVLEVNLKEPNEMPSTIDLILTTQDGATPLEPPTLLLATPPHWPALFKGSTLIGYEFGHFHGTRAGAVYTDIERVATLYQTKAPRLQVRKTRRALLADGFELDDDGTVLRGPDGLALVLKVGPEKGQVLVHSQRRWVQSKGNVPAKSAVVTPSKPNVPPAKKTSPNQQERRGSK